MGSSTKNKGKGQRPKLALVLGSGGIKCTAAIGLWEVFDREHIPVDMIVGCSGGSVFGAAIAHGMDRELIQETTLKLWARGAINIDYRSLAKILFPRILKFNAFFSLYRYTTLVKRLECVFGDLRIEDAHIPLYIVATDLITGKQVVLSKGKVMDAMMASISIPYIFSPKEINGQLLIDGGMTNPLPIDVASKEGGDIIVAMGHETSYHEGLHSPFSLVQQLTSITTNSLLRANLAFHNLVHYHEIVPIVLRLEGTIGRFDNDKIPYIIEMGKRATEEQVPYIKSLLFGDSP